MYCYVLVPPSQPNVTPLGPAFENREGTAIAKCMSSGFRPKTVKVTWTKQGYHSEPDFKLTLTGIGNNSFSLVSHYTRLLNRSNNGKTLSCNVSHMALTQNESESITITVLCRYVHQCFHF